MDRELPSEIQRLLRQAPFRPFALNLENGDRIVIEHPENIAFDPRLNGLPGSNDFYVISDELRVFGKFEAVSSVALVDTGQSTDKRGACQCHPISPVVGSHSLRSLTSSA